jgi:hypothetical protein
MGQQRRTERERKENGKLMEGTNPNAPKKEKESTTPD